MNKEFLELKASQKLEEAIAKLIISANYWGYIFGRIRKRPHRHLGSIMGVGPGTKKGTIELFYHPDLVEKTDEKSIYRVLEHEGMHLLNQHISRFLRLVSVDQEKPHMRMFKSRIWNIASDCAVNKQAQLPYKLNISDQEISLCHPDVYDLSMDRATESYYHTLYSKSDLKCPNCGRSLKNDEENQSGEGQGSSGQGQGDQESQEEQGDGQGQGDQESNQNQGQGKCPICGGDCQNGSGGSIDDHSQWNVPEGQEEDYAREIENGVKKMAKQAKQDHQRTRGTMPAYLQEVLNELLGPPKIPYYQMIRKLVVGSRLAKFKTAYNRANKKKAHLYFSGGEDQILPFPGKMKDKTFNIAILIDTSASQGPDDIAEALSGIKSIIENDKNCYVTVLECDTQVNKEYSIESVSDIDFEISGRGGTIMQPGVERLTELKADVNLVFTDGMCDNINELDKDKLPKKRMVWIISPNGTDQTVNKTGIVVWVEKEDD